MFRITLPLQIQRQLVDRQDADEAAWSITNSQDAQDLKALLWQWKCHKGRFAEGKATMGDKIARYNCNRVYLSNLTEAEVVMLDALAALRVRTKFIQACIRLGLGLLTNEQFLKEVK